MSSFSLSLSIYIYIYTSVFSRPSSSFLSFALLLSLCFCLCLSVFVSVSVCLSVSINIYIYIYITLSDWDKVTYLGSIGISSEKDINTWLAKAWTAIHKLSVIWKSDLTNKMKRCFFQAAVVSILLYGCTTQTLTKRTEKKLDSNYTGMLRAILNKSWRQRPIKLYCQLPPITKTIKVRRTRHAGYCWRTRNELISDVLLWTLSHGREKAVRPAWTYIQQVFVDTVCIPEDLLEAMNNRQRWWERVRDIRAGGMTWWWWWRRMIVCFLNVRTINNLPGITGVSQLKTRWSPKIKFNFHLNQYCWGFVP